MLHQRASHCICVVSLGHEFDWLAGLRVSTWAYMVQQGLI